jgi:excisionase family DNA binding protein
MNASSDRFITPMQASKILQVAKQTLVNWENSGKIKAYRTKGGHRRYLYSSIIKETTGCKEITEKRKICYCRVSTPSQKEDLERQVIFFKNKFPDYEIIKDIGSGLNFKRKGLKTILDQAIQGNIKEVVVTHKDRLCRFSFDFFERIIQEYSNGKILVLDKQETSPNQELVNDLISIITVFSARLYGLRSHSIKRKIKEASEKIQNSENEIVS